MPDDQTTPDYFLEIEAHFAFRRGTPFILSGKDWALMKQWQEERIPLAVILEAIDFCFEKRTEGRRQRTISSLRYCRHAVSQLWDERKELLVGGEGALPETDATAQLERLVDEMLRAAGPLPEAARTAISSAVEEIRGLPGSSIPAVEQSLAAIEERMFNRLRDALPASELAGALAAIDQQIGPAGRSDPVTIARTVEANLRRSLRGRFGLPRLSLFG